MNASLTLPDVGELTIEALRHGGKYMVQVIINMFHWSAGSLSLVLLVGLFTYNLGLVIYRLFVHPLAGFPGPKLCAASELHEFYCYIVKGGQWGNSIREMHEKYGPIVRTSPWELSIRDPEFYNHLYVAASTRKTNMWPRGRQGNGFDDSHHLTVSHNLHRSRRKHLEPFFSRQGIARLENVIAEKSKQLETRLMNLQGTGSVIHMDHALAAITGDIIVQLSVGTAPGLTNDPEFSPEWYELMIKTTMVAPVFRCFPWLNKLIQMLPESVIQGMYPKGISNMMLGKTGRYHIEKIKSELRKSSNGATMKSASVFHHLLSSGIPESETSVSRLQAESMILLLAGTLAGAHTLTFVVYYVLSNSDIETKLKLELKEVFQDYPAKVPSWSELEKLPFLAGCIREALRLNGLVGNLARCSPDEAIVYKQWTIPKNTPVGMSIYAMHTDPEVFPLPFAFKPDRWMGKYDTRMDRNFVPFTKGSRSCLGINLAWAELFIVTAMLFRPGGPRMILYDTEETDIKIVRDYIMGFPKEDAKGVKVKIS